MRKFKNGKEKRSFKLHKEKKKKTLTTKRLEKENNKNKEKNVFFLKQSQPKTAKKGNMCKNIYFFIIYYLYVFSKIQEK